MSQIDFRRMAAIMAFTTRYGMSPEAAARAALALHPLDDSPVPSRSFEKAVRKASRRYARTLRNLQGQPEQADSLTISTLGSYKELAVTAGEAHYIERYDKALTPDSTEGED